MKEMEPKTQVNKITQGLTSIERAKWMNKLQNQSLNELQESIVYELLQTGELSLKELEALMFDKSRRTLQREIKNLIDSKIVQAKGATNQRIHFLSNRY